MSELVVLMPLSGNTAGPLVIRWDASEESAKTAKHWFEEEIKWGGVALVILGEREAHPIQVFDPKAERILVLPQVRGG